MQLEVKNIVKSYKNGADTNRVLDEVTFGLKKGQVCTIIGPSGSGKSTLLNVIGGLDSIDSGFIRFEEDEISAMSKSELALYRRNKLGFVFQFYNLVQNLTAKENIEVCAYLTENGIELDELLEVLELKGHADKFPNELSGGQQQRVAIARALVKNPRLLLCDEPTGALDYKNSREVLRLLEKVNRQYGTTVIIVTHNTAISKMSHIVLKLRDGQIEQKMENKNVESAAQIEW